MTEVTGLVYGSVTGGHRLSYVELLSREFGLAIVDANPSASTLRKLAGAQRVLFSTLDDHLGFFILVAFLRSLTRRKTAALFLRPQSCLETWRSYYPVKKILFLILKRLPCLTLATITPYETAPEYGTVSNAGLTDPQYWDLTEGDAAAIPPPSELAKKIRKLAKGRKVLVSIGLAGRGKGLGFLVDCFEKYPELSQQIFITIVGDVRPGEEALVARLQAQGFFILGRFATATEVKSAYGVADATWCCYDPKVDQASGVFGRSVQYGCVPLLRSGSVTARLAELNQFPHETVDFGNLEQLALKLETLLKDRRPSSKRTASEQTRRTLLAWRGDFVDTLQNCL